MKAWQKGYEIEELEHWVEKFKNFIGKNGKTLRKCNVGRRIFTRKL